jgi:O-antigen/teichoic acid export membrane protein
VYWLILAEGALSFLLTHRRILPVADQKAYIVTGYGYVTFILSRLLQLAVLLFTRNYIAYLFSGIVAGLMGELVLYGKIGRMYPLLGTKLPPPEKHHMNALWSKVRSLFFCRLGSILCSSADNMAVFAFLGLSAGAEYSNYTMLTGTCLAFVTITTGAVSASVGNLGATSNAQRMKKVFGTVFFAVFVLSCFFAQALFFACPRIVGAWVGKDMILSATTTALFCLQLLASSVRKPVGVFLDAFGLFEREKYKSLAEGGITLALTLLLAPKFGIAGVVLGQLCASLGFSFFYEAYILYRYGFGTGFSEFLGILAKYFAALLLSLGLSAVIFNALSDSLGKIRGIGGIAFTFFVCALSVGTVFSVLFFDSEHFRQSGRYLKKMLMSEG